MALTQRMRSSIFSTFADVLGEEEAEAFMAEFPADEGERLVTQEFLRAELAPLHARLDAQDARLDAQDARMDALFAAQDARIDALFAAQDARVEARLAAFEGSMRAELHSLRAEMHRLANRTLAFNTTAIIAGIGVAGALG